MEDMSANSGIKFLAAVNGICAGGGYELALACDEIVLVDDGSASVGLPETPLLGVLPGTGGLTRVVDKRKVRRDLADDFSTLTEGVRGKRAVEGRFVDAVYPTSKFQESVAKHAQALAAKSDRPQSGPGITLGPLSPGDRRRHDSIQVREGRDRSREAHVRADDLRARFAAAAIRRRVSEGRRQAWALRAFREFDDALLRLALERARDRHRDRSRHRRSRSGARRRSRPARPRVSLAGARDHRLDPPHAEAHGPDLAQLLRADRAGQRVCRHAVRAGARRRSRLHARSSRRGEHDPAVGDERRRLSDEQRPVAPAGALPRRARFGRRRRSRTTGRSTRRPRSKPASSSPRPTTSTGTTRCAWRSRRARRSRPMR